MGKASNKKKETTRIERIKKRQRPAPEAPKPFKRMELVDANRECGSDFSKTKYMDRCPICDNKVVMHCKSCQVQITGCMCVFHEKVEALPEEEKRKIRLAKKGIWTP